MFDRIKETFKNNSEKFKGPVPVAILITFLVAIILLVATIINIHNATKDYTPVTNIGKVLPDMPHNVQREVEKKLQQIVIKNNPNYDDNFSLLDATILNDAVTRPREEEGVAKQTSFIVALNQLEQDYKVYADWSGSEPSVSIVCTTQSESIFAPFDCVNLDSDINYEDYHKVDNKLPYHTEIDGTDVSIYVGNMLNYLGNNEPYFQISVNACDDKNLLDAGVKQFKNFVKEQGVDPETLNLEIRSNCPGGF